MTHNPRASQDAWRTLMRGRRLHRVARITYAASGATGICGVTVCGYQGALFLPDADAVLPRCAHCCRAAGIPQGRGNPINEGIVEPRL